MAQSAKLVQPEASITSIAEEEEHDEDVSEERVSVTMVPRTVFETVRLCAVSYTHLRAHETLMNR
eukprot:3632574-Prymnesium_polylepis.1